MKYAELEPSCNSVAARKTGSAGSPTQPANGSAAILEEIGESAFRWLMWATWSMLVGYILIHAVVWLGGDV